MNSIKKNSIALTLGAVVVGSAGFASLDANASPFAVQAFNILDLT